MCAVLLVLGGCLAAGAPAGAATCGIPTGDGSTPRAVLVLDADQAVTDAVFRQRTTKRTLPLIFRVTGCEIAPDAPAPVLEVNPRRGAEELPDDGRAVAIRRVVADAGTLDVVLEVDPERFDPGSYGASVVLRAAHLVPSRTSISISRSEDAAIIPALVGAAAALGGLAMFALIEVVGRARRVALHPLVLVLVAGAGVVVGAMLGYVNYRNQDVWTLHDNWIAAATAGFGGSTGGLMAGLLRGLWTKDPPAA